MQPSLVAVTEAACTWSSVIGVRWAPRRSAVPETTVARRPRGVGHVVQQVGSIRAPIAPTIWTSGLRSRTRRFDAFEGGGAVSFGDLVELVDDDQGRRAVAGGRVGPAVDGVEVGGGVDHLDDAARAGRARPRCSG